MFDGKVVILILKKFFNHQIEYDDNIINNSIFFIDFF
jgi:hypothetical protein